MKLYAVTNQSFDKVLREAGVAAFDEEALVSALKDPRPPLRSAAAEKLAYETETDAIPAIVEALAVEWDAPTKQALNLALIKLGSVWLAPYREARGGQIRPSPFQKCAPSAPPILSLTLSQPPAPPGQGPVIHVSARNLTERPVAFFKEGSPADMFSATVLDARGGHARIQREMDYLYRPHPPEGAAGSGALVEAVLPAGGETSWDWRVGEDFDMPAPGSYLVSLGGALEYLNTTVCSNTLEVNVGR